MTLESLKSDIHLYLSLIAKWWNIRDDKDLNALSDAIA